jgi:hypothetical protein
MFIVGVLYFNRHPWWWYRTVPKHVGFIVNSSTSNNSTCAPNNVFVLAAFPAQCDWRRFGRQTCGWSVVFQIGVARLSSLTSWHDSLFTCSPRTHWSFCSLLWDSQPQLSLVSTASHALGSGNNSKFWFSLRMWHLKKLCFLWANISPLYKAQRR